MMKIRGALLPDEWLSAIEAGGDLASSSRATQNGAIKVAISLLLPIVVGGVGFYLIDYYVADISSKISLDLVRSIVTVVAILAGFMITTILFTGRPNGLTSLTSHELKEVRAKISYLVLSQCITLASHVVSALFCIFIIATQVSPPGTEGTVNIFAASVLAGLFLNSILRSAVLPLQIWEVHAFSIDVEISERIKKEQNLIDGD